MNQLGEKSLKTLEYYTVLQKLEEQAVSEGAKERVRSLRPSGDLDEIASRQKETSAAKELMVLRGSPSFSGIRDVTPSLKRAAAGGILNPRELLEAAALMRCARMAKNYRAEAPEPTALDTIFNRLESNKRLEERIVNSIISEEEIADGASSQLQSIRRQMRLQNSRIRETLNHMVSSPTNSKYLQDAIITQRNGRYVIPVKSEYRGEISGMVHDTSSSGATVFVEPQAVVQANNQLKILEGEEAKEIERILAEMTAEVNGFSGSLAQDYACLCRLDFIFAKAKLSYALNGCQPVLRKDAAVKLVSARHPLLDQKKAVPIDISLGVDYDTLVITGPNTGGKTVSLKTLGLLTLMTAAGLHIPAGELSEVGVFENIYADIGDEQSIEQSLSTFSAHMKTITAIVKVCRQGDMVLFDELGAGTDPTEGAALAVSIIEFARQMCALVAATTHYSELKVFALTTDGVENASCEFDIRTLRPTYRLKTGIPGKSNAFAISAKLGLPDSIIDRAKEQLSTEDARFEDVLATLEHERQMLEKYKAEADRMRRTAQSEKDKISSMKDKTEDESDRLITQARQKAENILKDARMTAETVFLELDDLKKKAKKNAADQNLAAAKSMLRSAIAQTEKNVRGKKEKKFVPKDEVREFQAGDEVELINVGVSATVITPRDKDGNVLVQAGILKMSVKENEIRYKPKAATKKPQGKVYHTAPGGVAEIRRTAAKSEVDVRGMCAEEAILEVDQFLSQALMAGLNTVTIIHGKGTGVLRAAIQQHLKPNKRIKTVRNGRFGEGEMGVTVVEFK